MNLFDLNLTLPISDPTWVFFLVLIIWQNVIILQPNIFYSTV